MCVCVCNININLLFFHAILLGLKRKRTGIQYRLKGFQIAQLCETIFHIFNFFFESCYCTGLKYGFAEILINSYYSTRSFFLRTLEGERKVKKSKKIFPHFHDAPTRCNPDVAGSILVGTTVRVCCGKRNIGFVLLFVFSYKFSRAEL